MRQSQALIGWAGKVFAAAALALCCASSAWSQCTNYTIVAGPATYVQANTHTGNHHDEEMTAITLPFDITLYGLTYAANSTAYVSSNGFVEFGWNGQYSANQCFPLSNFDFSTFLAFDGSSVVGVCPYWTDLSTVTADINDISRGVFSEIAGTAPNRDFVLEWRAIDTRGNGSNMYFEIIFHEGQTHFDFVYYLMPPIGRATVGVNRCDINLATFEITRASTQLECFAGTAGATAIRPFGGTSLRFQCNGAATAGACCDPAASACILAATAGSCSGSGVFVAGASCSPNPCAAPANDGCADAVSINDNFFPNTPSPVGNDSAADNATDCSAALHGVWYTYTAPEDCVLRCAAIGSQKAAWAAAPDCSTTPHCLPGGTNSSIALASGQNVKILATNVTPEASPAAALEVVFKQRTAMSNAAGTITPGATAYIPGVDDIGNHSDPGDGVPTNTSITFPFPVTLFGVPFTGASVSDDGFMQFGGTTANPSFACPPVSAIPRPAIFVFRQDLITGGNASFGKGVYTATTGTAPNRAFVVEWRAARASIVISPNPIQIRCEAVFYENQPHFDLIYDTVPAFGGASVGVQASGTGPSLTWECNSNVGNTLTDIGGGLSLRVATAQILGACCATSGACSTTQSTGCTGSSAFTSGGTCDPSPCPPPANDLCGSATDLNPFRYSATPTVQSAQALANQLAPYSASQIVGSAASDAASCTVNHGIWFTYTAPTQSVLLVTETGAQTTVWASSADCVAAPQCLAGETNQQVALGAGQTVKLLVGTSAAAIDQAVPLTTAFSLLPNECATALPLTPPTTQFGALNANVTASAGLTGVVCNGPTQRDLWYSINATRAGAYSISGTPITPGTAALSLDLFDACGGARLACATRSGTTNPVLNVNLAHAVYKLRVAGPNNATFRLELTAPPPCAADFDNNGTPSIDDLFIYINAWLAQDPSTDVNGGGVTIDDLFIFINIWLAGCP